MNEFDKKMSDVFDVTPFPNDTGINDTNTKKNTVLPVRYNEPDMEQDLTDAYQQSKENLQEFIDNGKEALEELINIAKAGQHPRAFEVYSGLLKNLVDANKELLATQKSMREMDEKTKKTKGDTNIDKAIFVGSTAELSKFLKKDK